MTTIYNDDKHDITVRRTRNGLPGCGYLLNEMHLWFGNEVAMPTVSDDALIAILLDRAKILDARVKTKASAARVTLLKKLKPGDDERGRGRSTDNG